MRLINRFLLTSQILLFPTLLYANSMSGIGYILLWGAEIVLFILYLIAGIFLWFLIRKNYITKFLYYFHMLLLAAGVTAAAFIVIINILLLLADFGTVIHHFAVSVFFVIFPGAAGWFCISNSLKFLRLCREKLQ